MTANPDKDWPGWKSFRAIKDTQLRRIKAQLQEIVDAFGAAGSIPADDNVPLGDGPEGDR